MEFQRKEQIQITVLSGKVETSVAGLADYYDFDWYVNVLLTKEIELTDYVEINRDTYQLTIERQEINIFFYELGFFQTIESIGYNSENVNFWSNIVTQSNIQGSNSPVLYNTLFNVMKSSLQLKSNVFNIQILPTMSGTTTEDTIAIVNKMNDIKKTTEANQIAFVHDNLPQ